MAHSNNYNYHGGPPPRAPRAPPPPPLPPLRIGPPSQPQAAKKAPLPRGTIGIGVETEFKLRYREERPETSFRLLARAMAAQHNREVPSSYPRMDSLIQNLADGPQYMSWKLVHDPSCETPASPWGIEMVSPIFRLMPNSIWREVVVSTWEFVTEDYKVTADETCSTHVHLSIVDDYSVTQLRRLAQAIIHFEPAFEVIVPAERRGNEYCRSNWIDNANFGHKRLSRQDAISILERCTTPDEIIQAMNPDGSRYFGWNFQALKKYKTVEFRRGAPSTTVDNVFRWVELATTFLRASLRTPSVSALVAIPANLGGLRTFLDHGIDTTSGVRDSRFLTAFFSGKDPRARLDPKPVGRLSTEKREKLQKKILLDSQSNPMLDNVAAAQAAGMI